MSPTSFQAWLLERVRGVLGRKGAAPAWILWCDPLREWLDLLRAASAEGAFELWAPAAGEDPMHELLLRARFNAEVARPRVIWLPVARADITWFKVHELEATSVWERSLPDALRDYGVPLRAADEAELSNLLAPYTLTWFGHPREVWRELTVGNATGALVDDDRVLEALAGPPGAFNRLQQEERFAVFTRRVVEDFGLPTPDPRDEHRWRVASLARLLASEAAAATPANPPVEGEAVIPSGRPRDRALRLLRSWQSHLSYLGSFEELVPLADATLGLNWWARNCSVPPRSLSSRAVESVLLEQHLERLGRIEDVDLLVAELERATPAIQDRLGGFWSNTARRPLPWRALGELASAASVLAAHSGADQGWRSPTEAVTWFSEIGWQVDAVGEELFVEVSELPSVMQNIRARLRRAWMRASDRLARRFSELLGARPGDLDRHPTAGEIASAELERHKGPIALIYLDACRYDLGRRLADLLNEGEPARRAELRTAIAPLPSVTALGMAFALPMPRAALRAAVADGKLRVAAEGFSGDLSHKEQRQKWLTERIAAAGFFTINDVIEGRVPAPGRGKRVVVVHGAEFDTEGHEGQLAFDGADKSLSRYATAIRRLRDRGYPRVVVVTDHGFFHWQPDQDELEKEKPTGVTLWSSRRAMVGTALAHRTALILPVSGSDLSVGVPRSFNAWRTYGGTGFFHGGATLQELVIPALVVSWPVRTSRVDVVLKPVEHITSRTPRIGVQAVSEALIAAHSHVARRVVVEIEDTAGRPVFVMADPLTLHPPSSAEDRAPKTVVLGLVPNPPPMEFGARLVVLLRDADDREILARESVTLKVDIDEW